MATPSPDPLGGRAVALAAEFAALGWDIAFYGVAESHADAEEGALRRSARCVALRATCEQAGRVPRLHFLPFDPKGARATDAAALIATCAQRSEGGTPPRCLIVAPSLWPLASADNDPLRATATGAERSSDIARWDSDEVALFHQANVTVPLCLARAHYAAWMAFRGPTSGSPVSVLERYAKEDASVLVLLDDAGLQRLVGIEGIPYAASLAALHATVPSLARAFAPDMRVSAVSAALRDDALADATLAQALCYVAEANTITGATLQLGGVSIQTPRSR